MSDDKVIGNNTKLRYATHFGDVVGSSHLIAFRVMQEVIPKNIQVDVVRRYNEEVKKVNTEMEEWEEFMRRAEAKMRKPAEPSALWRKHCAPSTDEGGAAEGDGQAALV